MTMFTAEEAREIVRIALVRGWATKPDPHARFEDPPPYIAKPAPAAEPPVIIHPALPVPPEETIHGKPITRDEAMRGLGDPATWPKEKAATEAEFRRKPDAAVPLTFCPGCGWNRVPIDRKECNHCGRQY